MMNYEVAEGEIDMILVQTVRCCYLPPPEPAHPCSSFLFQPQGPLLRIICDVQSHRDPGDMGDGDVPRLE